MESGRRAPRDATWDVVIVGAGPAGAAIAITLGRFGWRVLLVEQRLSVRYKLGESLPPASIGIVERFLGDLEGPQQGFRSFFRTAGNVSSWETEHADVADFFFTLGGYGLCVDRPCFDEALRSRAAAAGVALLRGVRFESCERIVDRPLNWRLTLASDSGKHAHRSRYLVDGSGRRAVVARALGVEVVDDDRLFAYAQWFAGPGDDDDRFTRIEATPNGWWYSNRLPSTRENDHRRLVVFHTDRDLPTAAMAAHRHGFDRLLADSTHIAPLLDAAGYRPCGAIRGAPAGSQRLRHFAGDAWMAVGDAAQAYDPLSSQGIDKALDTASHAGHMIHYALQDGPHGAEGLDGSNPYVRRYDEQQAQLWEAYLSQRDHYYGIQPRWSDQPFWQRRRSVVRLDPAVLE